MGENGQGEPPTGDDLSGFECVIDAEAIKEQLQQFPEKEFYAGFNEEFRRVKEMLRQRIAFRAQSKPTDPIEGSEAVQVLADGMADANIKAELIRHHRLAQLRDMGANDNVVENDS